jgi:4-alpha-glucanotransferase
VTGIDPGLAELAHRHGVATSFHDWRGGERTVSPAAVTSVLRALGVDPDVAASSPDERHDDAWRRMLPVYVVTRVGSPVRLGVHVPHGDQVSVVLELEDGSRLDLAQQMVWIDPRMVDGVLTGEATFDIPDDVPLGYHELHASSGERTATAQLIVVPDRLEVAPQRQWGFMVQLYSMRSQTSWGIGDLRDLAQLITWSARELGAGFVLINPLHAAAPVPPMEPSPYYPSSRRFVNPIYLCVDDVAEVAALPAAEVSAAAEPLMSRNHLDELIDRDAIWAAKRSVLERAFESRSDSARAAEFLAYQEEQGAALIDYATWCALADRFGLPWREWPTDLHDLHSAAVLAFRDEAAERVQFHAWLQWICAEQLANVQAQATTAGMSLGVLNDLAVGVSPEGADSWALQSVLADGVVLGAPADVYNQQGQRWNLPPWQPIALAAEGFRSFRDVVRASFAHGGGLRVDHILGLFRQWWVPDDALPADGTYVRLDHEAMVGILLLEAHRADALLVGEDLGNIEWWVRDYLRSRGILGTSILWFEHDHEGRPLPPDAWRELCLASVTTHDIPPAAGYLTGQHVELRNELGLLERPVDEVRAADEAERFHWLRALGDAGLISPSLLATWSSTAELRMHLDAHVDTVIEALHAYLGATAARLIGVYLPDVVGDRRPINQPGTVDEYPNWRVPMADAGGRPVLLDDLMAAPTARRLAQVVAGGSRSVTVASSGDQPRS